MCLFFNSLHVAGFDYTGVGSELQYVGSASGAQCVEIKVLSDGLTEAGEWFGVQVFSDWPAVGGTPDDQLGLQILPSNGGFRE